MIRNMVFPTRPHRGCCRNGFTLIEVIAALGVLAVATSIIISLFLSSLKLSESSRAERVAAGFAQQQLSDILANPANYSWPDLAKGAPGTPTVLALKGQTQNAPYACEQPGVMPDEPRALSKEQSFYENFTWQAYASLPQQDAAYIEITIAVHWKNRGKEQAFTLTSVAPRTIVEEGKA